MKAKILKQEQNGKNYSGEKEMVSTYDVVVSTKDGLKNVVTCRCYMGRSSSASVVYASIWVHGNNIYTAGHGQAGGYGYHKESAAIASAISSAGIELYGSAYTNAEGKEDFSKKAYISGVGDSAIEAALLAITKAAGFTGKALIVRN